tara:strand:+ start:3177 stop:3503 length:327 start_codon:yes stop_codon:yes gene_type:complete
MTIHPDFLSLMPDTIQLYKKSGQDLYNKPTWATSYTEHRGRVQYKKDVVRNDQGDTVMERGRIWLYDGDTDIDEDDKILLPDGTWPMIVAVDMQRDEDGPHHIVVHFQ